MQNDHDREHKAARPGLQESTAARTRTERTGVEPDADELSDPEEVWKTDERTPRQEGSRDTGGAPGRVADAGDIGGGATSPYSTETQSDSLARQTARRSEDGAPEKPER